MPLARLVGPLRRLIAVYAAGCLPFLGIQAQATGRVTLRTLGSAGEQVVDVPPGVHRFRVGGGMECVVVDPGADVLIMAIPGAAPSIRGTGATRCDDAWSEIIIDSVPAGVEVRTSIGRITVNVGSVVVRVDLPDTVRVMSTGSGIATQNGMVTVGPRERLRYVLRPAPDAPALLADTVLEPLPDEVPAPRLQSFGSPPRDPTSDLQLAVQRLRVMRSREPAAAVSGILSWPTLLGTAATLVLGYIWAADSLNERPNAGRNFGVSLGVTAGLWAVYWPLDQSANRKAREAGCAGKRSTWGPCEQSIRARIQQFETDARTLSGRRAAWTQDSLRKIAEFEQERATYPLRVAERERLVAAVEERNRPRHASRTENARRIDTWRALRSGSPLVLRSRSRRG